MDENPVLMEQKPESMELSRINYSTFPDFYNSIDEKGSLGLLALGSAGLRAWRMKKKELLLSVETTAAPKPESDKNGEKTP